MPYWGFGLFTSGYRNEIVIHGPVEERARLVHDWIAALQHNLWEFAHRASAKKTLQAAESSLKSNEDNWRSHQHRARVLNEAIASLEHHIDRIEKKGDVEASMIKLARLGGATSTRRRQHACRRAGTFRGEAIVDSNSGRRG